MDDFDTEVQCEEYYTDMDDMYEYTEVEIDVVLDTDYIPQLHEEGW